MNLLAHAYLSFNLPEILVGNMISDFIKGKLKFTYSPGIQQGIALHRAIDEFTDFHPVTQEAKAFFRPQYRLYSGAFVDIVYDHFLANDCHEFVSDEHLLHFTRSTYALLTEQQDVLPTPFANMLPHMKLHNWLYNYRTPDGISRSFQGMTRRAKYLNESDVAMTVFKANYQSLQTCYEIFFPSLKAFVLEQIGTPIKN